MGGQPRRRIRTLVVMIAIVVAGGVACASDPPTSASAPTAAPAGSDRPPGTATPSHPGSSTTSTTRPAPAHRDASSARLGPQHDGPLCSPTTPVEVSDGSFTPPTPQPGSAMGDAPSIGRLGFTTIADDLIMFGTPPIDPSSIGNDEASSVVAVGDLDRERGVFDQRFALDRCPVIDARTDGTDLWLLARTGSDASILVEVDLETGRPRWKQPVEGLEWWVVDGDAVRLALGGAVDDGSSRTRPPFGVETIEKGTGRSLASVDVQAERAEAMPSDSALWIRAAGRGHENEPFREVDLTSGALLRSVDPPRSIDNDAVAAVPVIQDGAMWAAVRGGVERRPLDTLVPQTIGTPAYPDGYLRMVVGPGGVWTVGLVDDALTVAVSRVDTTTATLQGSFTYTTYTATADRSGTEYPQMPQLAVDTHGARTRAPTVPDDGSGDVRPFAFFEIVIP